MSAAPASSGNKHSGAKLRQNVAALEGAMASTVVTVVDLAPVEAVAPPPAVLVVQYRQPGWPPGVRELERRLARAQERVALSAAHAE
jgi:hypothetical protein